jgi:hypothetical protein
LFGDPRYQYRDTYFVLFPRAQRPSEASLQSLLEQLGSKFELGEKRLVNGLLESATFYAPQDFSAIDIAYVEGEDVVNQIKEIREDFRSITVRNEDLEKLKIVRDFDARLDVFHFERLVAGAEDDECFDPGSLLLILERLADICHGIAYDPQSQSLL